MSAVYVHIPVCKSKCCYCDFFSVTTGFDESLFVKSVIKEIDFRKNFLNQPVESVYFGGGTPSLMKPESLNSILKSIDNNFIFSENPELTLEVNPDDLDEHFLRKVKSIGINRLSIGVQSLNDDILKFLNRRHSVEQAKKAIYYAKKVGFDNISVDLICGIPGLTIKTWKQTLDEIVSYRPQHISVYILTAESGTPLNEKLKKGIVALPDEEIVTEQFLFTSLFLKKSGYLHYEISNFALKGKESHHNSAYWKGKHYLGLGPSAHSYNGLTRQWNVHSLKTYIAEIQKGNIPVTVENLSLTDRFNDYIITTMRTSNGADINYINDKFGEVYKEHILEKIKPYISKDYILVNKNILTLTTAGMLVSDFIFRELIFDND